jgi:hypothetical protein
MSSNEMFIELFPVKFNKSINLILNKIKRNHKDDFLVYVYNFILSNQFYIYDIDPEYVIYISFILCDKFLNDDSYSLKNWSRKLNIPCHILGIWERKILKRVDYNVWVSEFLLKNK